MAPATQSAEIVFSIACRRCERLAGFLSEIARAHPAYYAKPVPSFGPERPALLIVGLAPGLHGANRTGRPFTGDHAGVLLYRTLHRFGFASRPDSVSANDALRLIDCRITNAVRCVPPGNKPSTAEVKTCNDYLRDEIQRLATGAAVLALGNVAHLAIVRANDVRTKAYRFAHGAIHRLPAGIVLFDSYHCSRYNTQTGRLTESMFAAVIAAIRSYLEPPDAESSKHPAK